MHVQTFCTPNKKFFKKEISKDATIEDAKKMFCEEINECNLESIKMIYNRQVLHDNIVVSSLNLKENDFILVIIKSEKSTSISKNKPEFESQIPEIKPLPFVPITQNIINNRSGQGILIIISKQVKILTNLPSITMKKNIKIIQNGTKDSGKFNNSNNKKIQRAKIILQPNKPQQRILQTQKNRIINQRRIRQNQNNTSNNSPNCLYFLPKNFRNKQSIIHDSQNLGRISNCIHLSIILTNIRFMKFIWSLFFHLILFFLLLIYQIFAH